MRQRKKIQKAKSQENHQENSAEKEYTTSREEKGQELKEIIGHLTLIC